jgi:hypothetical protein
MIAPTQSEALMPLFPFSRADRHGFPPLLLFTLLLAPRSLQAQPGGLGPPPAEGLNVFLDLTSTWVDFDYLRREIAFVNWVRDRQDAHVHILGASQSTGSGGREHTFFFIGLRTFAGRRDTLRYVEGATETEAESRDGITRILKMGLMPYVAATPIAARILISYTPEHPGGPVGPADDPWDFWVFSTGVHGYFSGESYSSSGDYSGSFSANRTTEQTKYRVSVGGSYDRSTFKIPGVVEYVNTTRSFNASANAVWGLGAHWSAGFAGGFSRSTYSNQIRSIQLGPALEYNIFPYSESTRRELTCYYRIGSQWVEYEEETIFDKMKEQIWQHELTVSLDFTETWGNLNISLNGSQYLHDLGLYSLGVYSFLNIRLFRGFSLNLNGGTSRICDQLYISKAGLTPEEVLLRRRALQTDYNYFGMVGFSYRFGSIYNNAVNPRMGGGFYY